MKQRILVVEDEPAIVDNIAYALETKGFEPVCCGTVAAAQTSLAGPPPALVILDVGLPDGSGLELCKAIRKTSTLPVIFLTARGAEVDRVVGLEIGADDYVVKPFSPRELTARVKAILRRSLDSHDPAAHGPFQVDSSRRTIRLRGTALPLSRYEYRILEIRLRHPGWVYSREQLMELAWDDPAASLDRSVDAHIKTLRAKLRAVAPDCDLIRTYWGRVTRSGKICEPASAGTDCFRPDCRSRILLSGPRRAWRITGTLSGGHGGVHGRYCRGAGGAGGRDPGG